MVEFYNVVNKDYINLCKQQVLDVRIKVELLDHYEHTIGEVTTKVSATTGAINVKYNQGVRRTCDITIDDINKKMLPNDENSVFFVNKKFKIYIGLYKKNWSKSGSDGTGVYHNSQDDTIYWFSQGIFITQNCDYDKKNGVLHLSGVDKFGFFTKDLNQHTLQNTYHISADSKLGQLISDIITIDMGNGMPTDTQIPIIHTSFVNQVLPYDIEKTANETIGDILIEIATAFNADIYYDTDGHLVFEPNIIDDYNRQAPVFEFGKNDSALIDMTLDFNYGDIVNQITVTGDNSDGVVYSSTATNENPVSSLRVSNIGIKAADIEETAMGYSDKRCSDYANYLLKKKMRMAIAGTITCTPLPHLDCNRVIKVYQNEEDVNEIDFLIEEVNIPLSPETYTLSVCNIQDLPLTCYTSMIPQSALSEWVAFRDTNSLGKYINRSNDTFVVVPATVNGISIIGIGGNGELSDGSIIPNGGVQGISGVKTLYVENGIKYIYPMAFTSGYPNGLLYSFEEIILPDSIISIGDYAFYYCLNLKSLDIPSGVERIGIYALSYCLSLADINVSENNRNYSSIDGILFDKNKSLLIQCPVKNKKTVISVPNSVNEILGNAFHGCTNLTNIAIPDNVTNIGQFAFSGCTNLDNIIIPESLTVINNYTFYGCNNLKSVTIGDGVTSIGDMAFGDCTSLVNVTIPDNMTQIGNRAFYNCSSITSITLGKNVSNIYMEAFAQCSALESIIIQNSDCVIYSSKNTICNGYNNGSPYFNGTIYGYKGSTAYEYSNRYAYNFVPFDIGLDYKIKGDYVEVFATGNFDTLGISEVEIPEKYSGLTVTTIAAFGFYNFSTLTRVIIPNSITTIDGSAFGKCTNLESVTIPNSVINIEGSAFYSCSNLKTIVIPNSITSIKDHLFEDCKNLESIIIPNSVTSIEENAFYNCEVLKNIYYTGTENQWNNIIKGYHWDDNMGLNVEGGTIIHYNYVP